MERAIEMFSDLRMWEEARQYAAATSGNPPPRASEVFQFGRIRLAGTQLFFSSECTVATVNLKPLCPGHVLVVPKRNVPLLAELPEAERLDLWRSVRIVQDAVCRIHGAAGCKIGVQDGRDAGQSVPHVHVHVLPQGQEKDKERAP